VRIRLRGVSERRRRDAVPKPFVTDGPFAETKEAVGGFYVVDCANREEALGLAGRVPASPGAAVEVLTIVEL
jgi:hypothetical protein